MKRSSYPRSLLVGAIAAVLVIVVVVAIIATQSGGGGSKAASSAPTTRASGTDTIAGPTTTAASGSSASTTTSLAPPVPGKLPLVVTVSKTSGLHDGETVKVHVVPKPGSDIYGIEARVCAPKADIVVESDFYPNQTGHCVLHALSSISDAHISVAEGPPYQAADLAFRVGTGTDSYTTEYGQTTSITCGSGHPCELVLLLQVPGGFGFQIYPLTYS